MRLAGALVAVLGVAAWPCAPALAARGPAPGVYDGGQTEVAARLLLGKDGRFKYELAYGALDEEAEGRWTADGDCAVLTSDSFKKPQFVLVKTGTAPAGTLQLDWQSDDPDEAQYFDYAVIGPDGPIAHDQLQNGGVSVDVSKAKGPLVVRILLEVYELASDPVPVTPGGGQALTFRFEPNEFGKVAFAGERLCDQGDGLELARFGRTLNFRPVKEGE